MDRFGDWLRKFKEHVEPDGVTSLLDTTIFYASSDCAFGDNHQINRQPVLLGGHGRGSLKFPGTHFRAVDGNPALVPEDSDWPTGTLNDPNQPAARNTADVLLTCLRAFNPSASSVGDTTSSGSPPGSTTPLTEIQA
jgi:hypothetical protein